MLDRNDIKRFYDHKMVAQEYICTRFTRPLGRVQHMRQVAYVNSIIRTFNIGHVLEIACGPARLTAEVRGFSRGVAIDNSEEMLAVAEQRISRDPEWILLKRDSFSLGFDREFDLVYSFRFIRHFVRSERHRIYRQIQNALKDDGLFVFDAVHFRPPKLTNHRRKFNPRVYDKVYETRQELVAELSQSGFSLIETEGCIKHFYIQAFLSRLSRYANMQTYGTKAIQFLETFDTGRPVEWMVLCRKRQ